MDPKRKRTEPGPHSGKKIRGAVDVAHRVRTTDLKRKRWVRARVCGRCTQKDSIQNQAVSAIISLFNIHLLLFRVMFELKKKKGIVETVLNGPSR